MENVIRNVSILSDLEIIVDSGNYLALQPLSAAVSTFKTFPWCKSKKTKSELRLSNSAYLK